MSELEAQMHALWEAMDDEHHSNNEYSFKHVPAEQFAAVRSSPQFNALATSMAERICDSLGDEAGQIDISSFDSINGFYTALLNFDILRDTQLPDGSQALAKEYFQTMMIHFRDEVLCKKVAGVEGIERFFDYQLELQGLYGRSILNSSEVRMNEC